MSKHTAGPWAYDGCTENGNPSTGENRRYHQIDGATPEHLATSFPYTVADTSNRHHAISPEEDEANARLIAAAPDHALIASLFCDGRLRWEPFHGDRTKGELCFGGLRYSTELDEFGVPMLTTAKIAQSLITFASRKSNKKEWPALFRALGESFPFDADISQSANAENSQPANDSPEEREQQNEAKEAR